MRDSVQETRGVHSVFLYCRASVADAGTTLKKHWANVWCVFWVGPFCGCTSQSVLHHTTRLTHAGQTSSALRQNEFTGAAIHGKPLSETNFLFRFTLIRLYIYLTGHPRGMIQLYTLVLHLNSSFSDVCLHRLTYFLFFKSLFELDFPINQ